LHNTTFYKNDGDVPTPTSKNLVSEGKKSLTAPPVISNNYLLQRSTPIETKSVNYAREYSADNSTSNLGCWQQPVSFARNPTVATSATCNDDYLSRNFAVNGQNLGGRHPLSSSHSEMEKWNQSSGLPYSPNDTIESMSMSLRQPYMYDNNVSPGACNSATLRNRSQYEYQQGNTACAYGDAARHQFPSFTHYMVPQDPARTSESGNGNHCLTPFDKLLMLASASHGQAQQQANARAHREVQIPQSQGSSVVTFQNQHVANQSTPFPYSYQQPHPPVDWGGWDTRSGT
jgi:hypothetical protein